MNTSSRLLLSLVSITTPLVVAGLVSGLVFVGCSSGAPKASDDPSTESGATVPIQASMQNMKLEMEQLLPLVVDRQAFESPQNEMRIRRDLQQLAKVASSVSHAEFKAKLDPSFGFLSESFKEEIQRTEEAFANDKKEFARYGLMNISAYCIECHTRTASGPAFQSPDLNQTLTRLKPLERGEYLLAVRQFDAALKEFNQVLEMDRDDKFNFYEYDRALRYALSITVKYQRDPAKTEQVIQHVLKSKNLPFFIRQASTAWLSSVQAWKKEPLIKNPTLAARIQRAEKLVQQGRRAQQGQTDRSGDIDLLRALSELHQILWDDLKNEQLGKVLLLTGQAYESVRDMTMTSMHESYFETCVRRVPHSAWARSCYKSLEESLFMGYTGSSGTHIPRDVQARLAELEKLAQPKAPKTTN